MPTKKKGTRASAKATTISYRCIPPCAPSNNRKHIGREGSRVVMKAKGVKVRLKFTTGSPFESGKKTITIPADSQVEERVGSEMGSFKYDLECDECTNPAGQPEMIVP